MDLQLRIMPLHLAEVVAVLVLLVAVLVVDIVVYLKLVHFLKQMQD